MYQGPLGEEMAAFMGDEYKMYVDADLDDEGMLHINYEVFDVEF